MTTMSPGLRVGTSTCSTLARKAGSLIAPLSTTGAPMPERRSPAVKVVVFQWPCGTAALQRSPRRDRIRRKRGARAQAIGPSRGGQTTKLHALTDVVGRPYAITLTPGNVADVSV